MTSIHDKFAKLGVDSAPGQELRQDTDTLLLSGDILEGTPVDFSHGDVNAFPPVPGSLQNFSAGFEEGADQAYTEYRGRASLRDMLSVRLAEFSGAAIDADQELILTPGTQGALFLAMGASIGRGDKVAIIEPDYFANRKLVEFFDGEILPVAMRYRKTDFGAGLDLDQLEAAFTNGARLLIFSNPNNPTGVVYAHEEVAAIGRLAEKFGATVIADELYSRQIFDDGEYTHLRSLELVDPERIMTILGPSKTESLSGFRLGAAFGSPSMISRMEKLQAIVSLRAAGYCQAVLASWFAEPEGWMRNRVAQHQAIRDDLMTVVQSAEGFDARLPGGGSYLFPSIPETRFDIVTLTKALRMQAGVSVTPGLEFGPQFGNEFRVNFSQDHAAAVAAMHRIVDIVNRYRL